MLSASERAKVIREATLKAVQDRDQLSDQAVEELIKIYDDSGEVIAEQIKRVARNNDQVSLGNLQDLLSQVRQELDTLEKERNKALYRHIETSAGLGGKPFAGILPPSQLFAINNNAVRFVQSFAGNDGLQLSDRLWRLRQGDRDTILGHIQQAIINGEDASHAMMRSMGKGEGVPAHVAQAYQASKVGALQRSVRELMTGAPDPATGRGVVYQAERVFRTEINRAHGEAYIANAFAHPDVAGVKFMLSPNHRIVDVCDKHASADLYNLGPGVYPNRAACPWPAHPNTRSYVEVVFREEIGQVAKPEPSPLPQPNVAPAIQNPAPAPVASNTFKPLRSLAEIIPAGHTIAEQLLQSGPLDSFVERLHKQLNQVRPTMTPCKVVTSGKGADSVKAASLLFPDDWTKIADAHGPLNVMANRRRGLCYEATQTERLINLPVFGVLRPSVVGEGFISTDRFATSVHEFTHRIQHSVKGLDDLFQELHHKRTAGDRLEYLKRLYPTYNYEWDEVTRKDHYIDGYQGKVYRKSDQYHGLHGAVEVMTIGFESVLSGDRALFATLVKEDREILDLVVGALFHYAP